MLAFHPIGSLDWIVEHWARARSCCSPILSGLVLLGLVLLMIAAIPAFSIQNGERPWSRRSLVFSPRFASVAGLAVMALVGICGIKVIVEEGIPPLIWLGLLPLTLFGWLVGRAVLSALRRDITASPFIDGLLIGMPLGATVWLLFIGLPVVLPILTKVLLLVIAAAIAIFIFFRKENSDA